MGLAVDNLLGLIYFPLISLLGNSYRVDEGNAASMNEESNNKTTLQAKENTYDNFQTDDTLYALAIAACITALSETLSRSFALPALPISTLLSIFSATVFSKLFEQYVVAGIYKRHN